MPDAGGQQPSFFPFHPRVHRYYVCWSRYSDYVIAGCSIVSNRETHR